jgi:hypothetical protein
MKKKLVIYLFLIHFSGLMYAQNLTINEYSTRLMSYFLNKNNNIIFDTIYNGTISVDDPNEFDDNVMFFFYGIKKDNIDRYNYFYSIVRQSNNQRLIAIFENIEKYNLDQYFLNPTVNASLNDIYWTLYFSSGNINYLDKIMAIIELYHESNDMMLYLTARSGIWSFKGNMQYYPTILNYINNSKNIIIKNYILNTSIEDISRETVEFIRKQRDKGIW